LQKDPDPDLIIRPLTILNKHIYVLNNAVKYKDPSGMFIPDIHGNYCGNNRNRASLEVGVILIIQGQKIV